MCKIRILIVDNENNVRQLLKNRLSNIGYKVILAVNGREALAYFATYQLDLIILDFMLFELDGYEVCREIRKNSQVPIIGLTALSKISDRLKGFNLGVDDYVIKPFSPKELEVRIKSILWRSNPNNQKLLKKNYKTFQIGGLTFNLTNKLVSKNNLKIRLTDLEFNLFELLVENAGKELSRVTILDNVWGYIPSRYIDTRIVDVQISRIRAKIEENPSNPELIITVRGIGYMFRGHKDTKAT